MKKNRWHLKSSDYEMSEWTYNYLEERFPFRLPQNIQEGSKYQHCNNLLNALPSEEARKLLVMEIQNAWRQEKQRRKQKADGKSTRSYSLSNEAWDQLKDLATGSTLAKTLEKLINQAYNKQQKKRNAQSASNSTSLDYLFPPHITK